MILLATHKYRLFILLFELIVIFLYASKSISVEAQGSVQTTDPAVELIFNTLTPKERVGQLFMVSFNGADISPDSDIAELIQEYRIGGVLLSAQNENFVNNQNTPAQILTLTNNLQRLAQQALSTQLGGALTTTVITSPVITSTIPVTATAEVYTPLPLYIGVNHEGDGFPETQIRDGLAPVPSQMALGATWHTDNARWAGKVVGYDLSLIGVNMLLGPSLDVLDNPRLDRGDSLGIRTFGGHPYWVGEMGYSYIQGVHQGSDGKVLTIAKHFPGFGSSDREINQGVPTLLKSLDDLRRVELQPFFRVTHLDPNALDGITDGLMTAHVRYQGLQGNVPISLDARNLPAILALKEIAPWRNEGGLVVSAPLGAPAALEGIAAGKENFPARRLAQDAFLAGSDILFLDDFAFANSSSQAKIVNIKNAIGFFQEKYQIDSNFQAAVDRAVRRIIKAKIKIYGEDLLHILVQLPESNLAALGDISIDLDQIAQESVTLITPNTQEGLTPLTDPPQPGEKVLIFTDARLARDCPSCPEFEVIEVTALEKIILQLFGPDATGQITSEQINSFNFADLKALLSGNSSDIEPGTGPALNVETETAANIEPGNTLNQELETASNRIAELEALLQDADWVILAMLNISPRTHPQSDAVRVLLRNRLEALRNKKLILFAFEAPYFLDETEISQLTAYYGFYSKTQDYLEAAARLLFQQFKPSGASPVAIPAIGPLNLSPDPNQIIQLEPVHKIDKNGNVAPLEGAPEASASIDLEVGEGILFKTGIIMDKNGNPVPDGTLVDFFRFYPLEGLSLEPLQSKTTKGVAEIIIIKERDTPLQVRASSNLAVQSVTFSIGPGIVDTPTPTPTLTLMPTLTPTPSSTPSPTSTPVTMTATPTIDIVSTPTPVLSKSIPSPRPAAFIDLIYSLLGAMLIGGISFTLGGERFSLEERVRSALVAIAVGLVGYILYTILGMALPRTEYMSVIIKQSATGHWVAPLITLLFAIVGVLIWHLKPGRIFWKTGQ